MDEIIKVECTWGDGPDVTVSLEGKHMVLLEEPTVEDFKYGIVSKGLIDLTYEEAKRLANDLLMAVSQVDELVQIGFDYDEYNNTK